MKWLEGLLDITKGLELGNLCTKTQRFKTKYNTLIHSITEKLPLHQDSRIIFQSIYKLKLLHGASFTSKMVSSDLQANTQHHATIVPCHASAGAWCIRELGYNSVFLASYVRKSRIRFLLLKLQKTIPSFYLQFEVKCFLMQDWRIILPIKEGHNQYIFIGKYNPIYYVDNICSQVSCSISNKI